MTLWLALACVEPTPREPGVGVFLFEQQASWVRNFNPFAPTSARQPTGAGVYEPLMIYNPMEAAWVPWLATEQQWLEQSEASGGTLCFTTRQGVQWSDGEPFSARDVVFTFELMRQHPGADLGGVWGFLDSVSSPADDRVCFGFARPFVSGVEAVAQQAIVPAHIWSELEDPLMFSNDDPVGTGPFTEVQIFNNQVFQLGANPHYWQDLGLRAIRMPALATNDSSTLALIQGELDWAGLFVPAVDRVYIERDPEHFQAWFPTRGGTIFLYPNTTQPPLDDPRVRKALSLAIDRERMVDIAMYGYTTPSHPSGLSDGYTQWQTDAEGWSHLDREQAAALLDEAGLTMGPKGWRTLPDGSPLNLSISCPAGWSDWVRAIQLIARDLQAVGLNVKVAGSDYAAWYEQVSRGQFDLSMGWTESGPTPIAQYKALMHPANVKPVGEAAFRDWHRFGDPRAGELADRFEASTDPAEQHAAILELGEIFLQQAPAIPLFPAPAWGESSSRHITGFPTPEDPYAVLSPNRTPGRLLIMTRLQPVPEELAGGRP
ncbi:MAG: ABC transporter substrate-binding protein [Myxococcota bacterium]|nr:ABC transporter substrate-binding protein [Myxococcota bacterium]